MGAMSVKRARRVGDLAIMFPKQRLALGAELLSAYLVLEIPNDAGEPGVLGRGVGFAVNGRVRSLLVSPVQPEGADGVALTLEVR